MVAFAMSGLFLLPGDSRAGQPPTGVFNVKSFGATGDGATLDTPAISRAINACRQAGGGRVVFPAGIYVTGTFEMFSDMTLDVQSGAVILGSTNLSDYGLKQNYGIDETQIGQSGEGLRTGIIVATRPTWRLSATGCLTVAELILWIRRFHMGASHPILKSVSPGRARVLPPWLRASVTARSDPGCPGPIVREFCSPSPIAPTSRSAR